MSHSLKGLDVFLVEDDFLILLDMKFILEDAGASVISAATLAQADTLSTGSFDAAVLDIRLPDGDAYALAARLKAQNTPLIFHTGNANQARLRQEFPEAVTLSKPISEAHLLAAVKQQSSAPVQS
ncbi:response regulator [Yoonia sp. SS1-5]|uniref:Response regulator n=1 Tax=Yoonia rhodophyticola TaxID=3137370 RepID=A0AAN0MD96_9RHOB